MMVKASLLLVLTCTVLATLACSGGTLSEGESNLATVEARATQAWQQNAAAHATQEAIRIQAYQAVEPVRQQMNEERKAIDNVMALGLCTSTLVFGAIMLLLTLILGNRYLARRRKIEELYLTCRKTEAAILAEQQRQQFYRQWQRHHHNAPPEHRRK